MPVTIPPSITALPTPPDPNDRATFNARAYPWSVAQQTLATEVGAVASNVFNNATDAAESALAAETAAAASNAAAWVSGTTYAIGDVVWSPIDFKPYRRKTAGAGTTDPSADATNWAFLGAAGTEVTEITTSSTWTKPTTLPASSAVFVEVWGGGGGGGRGHNDGGNVRQGGGGGGGAYNSRWMQLSDLTSTVSVTIGAGGAAGAVAGGTGSNGAVGGTTTFGAYLSAFGGGGGIGTSNGNGGGGGGPLSAGAVGGVPGEPLAYQASAAPFGDGQGGYGAASGVGRRGEYALHKGGGGGGGGSYTNQNGYAGGNSVNGGGGGGGSTKVSAAPAAQGGTSVNAGNGGNGATNSAAGTAGAVPAGGGGGGNESYLGGDGAAGMARITVFPGV